MADQFIGEIRCVGFNFPPTGWAYCNGQLLPISQNTALFSLLGTFYGGDGKSTFALPNLQGNVALHQGQGPGLSFRVLGEASGSAYITLLTSEMPVHNHTYRGDFEDTPPNLGTPSSVASICEGPTLLTTATSPQVPMSFNAIGVTGGSQPHNNMMPYLTLNFVIALQGIFPSRA